MHNEVWQLLARLKPDPELAEMPNELLLIILEYINCKPDLAALRLVSRHFSELVPQYLYRDVDLARPRGQVLTRMNSLLCGSKNLRHVETLRTGQCGNLETMAFNAVLLKLPMKRKLSIQFEYENSDVKGLISALTKIRGLESLRVRVEGREGIRPMQRSLAHAVKRHKERLREIMIEDRPSLPHVLFGDDLLETIKTFENLCRLALPEEYFQSVEQFRDLVASLPSLVALRIQQRHQKARFVGFGAHNLVNNIPAASPCGYFCYVVSSLCTRTAVGFVRRGQGLMRIERFSSRMLSTSWEEFEKSTWTEIGDEYAEYLFSSFWPWKPNRDGYNAKFFLQEPKGEQTWNRGEVKLLFTTQVGSTWDESGFLEEVEGEGTGDGGKIFLQWMEMLWLSGSIVLCT